MIFTVQRSFLQWFGSSQVKNLGLLAHKSSIRSYERFHTFDRCSAPNRPIRASLGDAVDAVRTSIPPSLKSLRLTVWSERSVLRGDCWSLIILTITIGYQRYMLESLMKSFVTLLKSFVSLLINYLLKIISKIILLTPYFWNVAIYMSIIYKNDIIHLI